MSTAKCKKVERFIQTTQSLFLDARTADIQFVFQVDDKVETITAHKLLLAKESDVFDVMFYGNWKEEKVIEIKDVPAVVFTEFLKHFYMVHMTITWENVAGIMLLADKYNVQGCMDTCQSFLQQSRSIDDIFSVYELAVTYRRAELTEFCTNKMAIQPDAVLASNDFRCCSHNVLKSILEIGIVCFDPFDLFKACMQWAECACPEGSSAAEKMNNCRKLLGDCFYLLPFRLMKLVDVANCIGIYKDLFTHDELADLVRMMVSKDPIGINKFQLKANGWNLGCDGWTQINCEQEIRWNNSRYYVDRWEESRVENIHAKCLVGSVELFTVRMARARNFDLACRMIIVEKGQRFKSELSSDNDSDDDTEPEETILLRQNIKMTYNAQATPIQLFKLAMPIIFEQNKQYVIRIHFRSDWERAKFFPIQPISGDEGIVSGLYVNYLYSDDNESDVTFDDIEMML